MKKHKFNMQLNEIKQSDDKTKIPCTFIIMDYDVSRNNVIIDKATALEAGKTLLHKPVVTKYKEVSDYNTPTDNLGGHEEELTKDRYGNLTVKLNTTAIGVFTSEGYNTTVTINGEEKEVMAADAELWYSRYPDACDLLLEWYQNGVNINTSCEYLYNNYSVQDGVEYHHSPIFFEGHAILASENRGNQDEVLPAYEHSKLLTFNDYNNFERLVAQAVVQDEKDKEVDDMKFFKKLCELSHGDIRTKLYEKLDASLSANENSWISDVYETYFVANIYAWNNETDEMEYDKNFKFNYSKNEEAIEVDLDSKTEVQVKRDWVEVTEVQSMQNELQEKTAELETVKTELNSVKETVETIKVEKEDIQTQFNTASDTLVSLNSEIEILKPFKEKVEAEKLEKALNEKKEFYLGKFSALNAVEKFESEEVQGLVKKTISEDQEGKDAVFQLNSMLIDMVVASKEPVKPESPAVRETASKRENLIPASDDFDSRYSL